MNAIIPTRNDRRAGSAARTFTISAALALFVAGAAAVPALAQERNAGGDAEKAKVQADRDRARVEREAERDRARAERDAMTFELRGLENMRDFGDMRAFELRGRPFAQAASSNDPATQLYLQGRELAEQGEWAKAGDKFTEVVAKYPQSKAAAPALYYYAASLKKQGKYDDSYKAAERVVGEYAESRWAADAKKLMIEVAQILKKPVPFEVAQDNEDDLKIAALRGICSSNPQRCVQISTDILKPSGSAGPRLREAAVIGLGQNDDPAATVALLDYAKAGPVGKPRKLAVLMLGRKLDDKQDGDRVFLVLKGLALADASDDTSDDLGTTALMAIAQDGDNPRTMPFLIDVATTAKAKERQRFAILQLGQRNDPKGVEALVKIYDANPDPDLKRTALISLSQSESPRALEKLMDVVRTASNVELRRIAIGQLAQRDPNRAVQVLVEWYDREKDETLKESIIDGLGQTETKPALQKLMQIAKSDPIPEMRKRAIIWIGHSDDPEATKFLEDILK